LTPRKGDAEMGSGVEDRMDDWPQQIDYKEIMEIFYKNLKLQHQSTFNQLVAYMKRKRLDWRDVAPSPPFNAAVVSLWRTGGRRPNLEHIRRMIGLGWVPGDEVRIPSDRDARLAAEAGTLKYIDHRWFSRGDGPAKAIDIRKVEVLEYFTRNAGRLARYREVEDFLADVAGEIGERFPASGIRTADGLRALLGDWLKPHAAFYDALIEDDKLDEFQQGTSL
jgi:hypothetical protein